MATHPERFKANLLDFFAFVESVAKDMKDWGYPILDEISLTFAKMFLKKYIAQEGPENIMNSFIKKSHKYWVKINSPKDVEEILVEHTDDFFPMIPKSRNKVFYDIFMTCDNEGYRVLPNDDMERFSEFIKSFIIISIKYIHEQRNPIPNPNRLANSDLNYENDFIYSKIFFSKIKLKRLADQYDVELKIL